MKADLQLEGFGGTDTHPSCMSLSKPSVEVGLLASCVVPAPATAHSWWIPSCGFSWMGSEDNSVFSKPAMCWLAIGLPFAGGRAGVKTAEAELHEQM